MENFKYPFQFEEDGVVYTLPAYKPTLARVRSELQLTEDDVVVAGYSKTGTHFVDAILHHLSVGPDEAKSRTASLDEISHYIEFPPFNEGDPSPYDLMLTSPRPWHIHTHLYASFYARFLAEQHKSPRFICLLRNPKDILVSYYHFHKILPYGIGDLKWEEFFEMFKRKMILYGDPIDHQLSWWSYRHHPRVLFVTYEDLIADGAREVRRLADFLGYSYSDREIEAIVEATSFKKMKNLPTKSFTKYTGMFPEGSTPFTRKGIKGDWKTLFTDDQNAYIDQLLKTKTDPVGLTYSF